MSFFITIKQGPTNRKAEGYNEIFIFSHLEIVLTLTGDDKQNSIIDMKSIDRLHCKEIQQIGEKFKLWRQTDLDYKHDPAPAKCKSLCLKSLNV